MMRYKNSGKFIVAISVRKFPMERVAFKAGLFICDTEAIMTECSS